MTPAEQDKELRGAIVNYRIKCDYYLSDRDEGFISQEEYEAAISSELDTVVQLITADRKRVALEAELKVWMRLKAGDGLSTHDGCFELHPDYINERIAELKAQQEENGKS